MSIQQYDETQSGLAVMPVVSVNQMIERYQTIQRIKESVMQEDIHYGVIPGTGEKAKPTLLKPGAETLCTAFGLTPIFEALNEPDLERVFATTEAGDTPFFIYRYRCVLQTRDGRYTVGSGIGSCNSHEKKYRYRNADRACPQCGKTTIIKGKAEYGGGWLCFAKKGGCGTKFNDGDPGIEGQQVGQIANPDIAEVINTIDKMAQKRALVAATLIAVGASDFFTQDIEDMPQFYEEARPPKQSEPQFVDGELVETPADDISTKRSAQKANGNAALLVTDLLNEFMHDLSGAQLAAIRAYSQSHSDVNHERHWDKRLEFHYGKNVKLNQVADTVEEFINKMASSHESEG